MNVWMNEWMNVYCTIKSLVFILSGRKLLLLRFFLFRFTNSWMAYNSPNATEMIYMDHIRMTFSVVICSKSRADNQHNVLMIDGRLRYITELESVAIANALQLEGRTTSRQSFWAVLAKFVLRMRRNCYIRASDKIFWHAIRFSDSDFLKRATSWRFDDVFMLWPWPLTPWPWTFVVHRVSRIQTL